jgi:hypothetical protein
MSSTQGAEGWVPERPTMHGLKSAAFNMSRLRAVGGHHTGLRRDRSYDDDAMDAFVHDLRLANRQAGLG